MEDKQLIKKLANDTMFRLNDLEIEECIKEYHHFLEYVDALDKIDTSGIEPLVSPIYNETTYLRNDIETHTISVYALLKNVKESKDNQIKVPKVVK